MATNLSTCHPGDGIEALNRLPGLAEPLLQIDLERELQQLRREDSWQRETGRSSKTLAKYPDFRIVLILMKSGTRMRQHRAEGRISIQQLKGQVCIHLADRKVNCRLAICWCWTAVYYTTSKRWKRVPYC